jgi:hypothetical protein
MRPNVPVTAAACAALLLIAGAARAADVAVLPVQGTNLAPGEADAIGALVADAFATESGAQVAPPAETARVLGETGNVQAAVAKLGAREYVETSAIRLTTRIRIRTVLRDVSGAQIHAAEMTAASLDDAQPVSVRLARALVRRTSVDQTRTVRDVTRREGQAPNRTFTEKVMGLKSAVIWPSASGKSFDPSVSFQFDGRLETRAGFLEFGAGAVIPTNGSDKDGLGGVFMEFGGSLYLAEANASPYIGAGFVPRIYFTSDGGGAQAAAYAQAGVMFMRESSSRIYVELRGTKALTPIEEEFGTDPYGGSLGTKSIYPLEIGLQIGVGW